MMRKIPKHITLVLNETDTIFLLDLNSSIVAKDTEECEAVEADNQLYEYLTKGKGRNRKIATIGVQTLQTVMKTRSTDAEIFEYKDNSTFASNWEMYDTYINKGFNEGDAYEEEELEDELDIHSDSGEHKLKELHSNDLELTNQEKEMEKLEKNQRFFDAALVIERFLANNCYNDKQKQFKGLYVKNEFSKEAITYNYKLNLLWTFVNDDTKKRCVTGIAFNPLTDDMLAVGYGKYYFMDRKTTGVVMIWNIKNPKQPERQYYFQYSVTSLAFSQFNPNFLAVGFYNGNIKILDVSKRELKIVEEDLTTSFEPAWDIHWFQQDKEEYFLACFGDGLICRYKVTHLHLRCEQIMRLAKIEGKLKGLQALRMFEGNDVSSTRYAPAICLSMHPSDPLLYFVGTSEGVIHKCSINYHHQHLDMLKVHEGSIHAIKFSPFVNKLWATCGDDFQACLWADGINEPLILSRYCLEPVLDLDWSPSHSTIIVSLRGNDILIWDFQRNIYSPQSQTKSPTNSTNTICKFTRNGHCLIVGDIDGNVHVFSVEGLPVPAFFQENLFFQSMKRMLVTNPELIQKIQKLGSLNFDKK